MVRWASYRSSATSTLLSRSCEPWPSSRPLSGQSYKLSDSCMVPLTVCSEPQLKVVIKWPAVSAWASPGILPRLLLPPFAHREYDKLCAGGSRADPSIGDGSTDVHPRVRTNPLCTQGSALLPWLRQPVRFAPSGSLLACNNPFPCRLFGPFD